MLLKIKSDSFPPLSSALVVTFLAVQPVSVKVVKVDAPMTWRSPRREEGAQRSNYPERPPPYVGGYNLGFGRLTVKLALELVTLPARFITDTE